MSKKGRPKDIEAVYPLSPMQQGMLFHTLYHPEAGQYFEQMSATFRGELDVEAFRRAWQRVIDRNAILRTSFVWKKVSRMMQVVHRQAELPFQFLDWRDLSPEEQEERFEQLMKADREKGFQLGKPPLLRITLIQTGENHYKFLWSHHHILLDGWSLPILLREVFAFYEAFRAGRDIQLPPTPPFGEYIRWLQQQDMSRAEAFWKAYLKGFQHPTPLVVDTLAGRDTVGEVATRERFLSPQLTQSLQQLAAQQQLTLSTLVQLAWALLLYRYSGERDVVFGLTLSGRPHELPGAENMMGLFINTLPVRVQFHPDQSVLEVLQELQARQVDIQEFQYTPLVEVQGWSEVPRHTPLFQSIFVFENYPVDASIRQQKLSIEISDIRSYEKTNFPITVVSAPGDPMAIKITYDTERFTDAAIERMLGHLERILSQMVTNPKIRDISILTPEERSRLLEEWNPPAQPFDRDTLLPQRIEAVAQEHPDRPAVCYQDQQLSYQQLNEQANQLAHFLREQGIRPDDRVGVCLPRSTDLVVAIVGILKSGAAYVPIDPTYPEDRIRYILQDSAIPVLITRSDLEPLFTGYEGKRVLLDQKDAFKTYPTTNPEPVARPENLAYVIYTSGSTGRPKGVMIEHQSVLHLMFALQERIYDHYESRVYRATLNAPVLFDASVQQLVLLGLGHTLDIVPDDIRQDGQGLLRFLIDRRIDVLDCVPTQLKLLIEAGLFEQEDWQPPICLPGGEAIDEHTWKQLQSSKRMDFYNMYGPTECTVDSVVSVVKETSARPNIGRALQNMRVYILDAELNPVPVGVVGELYLSGAGVGRGYLNRPELTAERFLPDPFSPQPGARMYRTGDLGRWLEDGTIEFVGRADTQVKVHGFRIELGEIESVLAEHPAVKEAVVQVHRDERGHQRLVAYWIRQSDATEVQSQDLREYLREHLPAYMVPAVFMEMDRFPLTPNGKIDRRALPRPQLGQREAFREYAAPRTPTEEILARIWEDVLGVDNVGAFDNFFDLGGHSLMATQLVSRIRNAFQIEIPIRQVFEAANLAELAQKIDQLLQEEQGVSLPPFTRISREGSLPLSFAQQRLWFIEQLEPGTPMYNIPSTFRVKGDLKINVLEQALTEIVRRHEVLRTAFLEEDGQGRPVIHPPFAVKIPVRDLSHLSPAEQDQAIRKRVREFHTQPFDLAKMPLFRIELLKLAPTDHVVLFTMHHIISDGWSVGVFIRELAALYRSFSEGKPAPLPELPIQYVDYAAWQREWLRDEVLEKQLAYWREKLKGAPPLLELPTDRPRPPIQSYKGAIERIEFSEEMVQAVEKLSRKLGVTPFMILLAAFNVLLARYSGQEDILVGTPIANRRFAEIEPLIGFFVNTLVIRTDLSGNPSFTELIRRVREVLLEAYAHQDLPFEKLVEELQPPRNLSHSPFFQVAFVLQNMPVSDVRVSGIQLSPMAIDSTTAKYDLTFYLNEGDGKMVGLLEYNTDLFDRETIQRMLNHYQYLLAAGLANPDEDVFALPMMNEAELDRLLVEWNRTETPFPADRTVPDLFEEWVQRQPDAPAVVFTPSVDAKADRQVLTYRELDQRANRLANWLKAHGVGPETLVGVCMHRSPEMLVGIMGILKAEGAFVPIDPAYPTERIQFMMEDSGLTVLLTQKAIRPHLPETTARVVALDEDWEEIAREPDAAPPRSIVPQNLAYVIYTSGSTGKPKGTMLHHVGLANLVTAQIQAFDVGPGKRILQFSSLSFDASVWELVMALLSGAALHLTTQEVIASGVDLLEIMKREKITTITLPPSVLAVWPETELPDLDVLITAGEKVGGDLVKRWGNGRRFFNAYGPTETTVCASMHLCRGDYPQGPPIGRPIANFRLYVVDRYLRPVPIGVPGELVVEGVGLARGYLKRPDLTAEKFVPNPFSQQPGSRLYRTGDLVRFLPDGEIEFLGRIDFQVKVRGFRIELEEIEAVLETHPDIRNAAVLARTDMGDDTRLVGYIVPEPGKQLTSGQVRNFLQQHLPAYMIPSVIVQLKEMPLTPAGKIDRRALPKPELSRADLESEYVAPRNDLEAELAQLAAELLGMEKVGIYDNFFELGGHSLMATQFISRVKNRYKVNIQLRQIFETPTIAALAEHIQELRERQQFVTESEQIERVDRGEQDIQQLLSQLENLSEEEARELLEKEMQSLKNEKDGDE
ncbi:MAG: amino acid adenylation domain-containing protein [Calditrichaeota bacterium]|nr:amino acid adenylation domain-containing protein [Calditrichota bacterium]